MAKPTKLDFYTREAWINNLKTNLIKSHGNAKGSDLYAHYEPLFDYFMHSNTETAIADIRGLERCKKHTLATQFECSDEVHTLLNIYALDHVVELSQSLAILQSMGLRVLIEKPKQIELNNQTFWIHRYQLIHQHAFPEITTKLNQNFEALYLSCWQGNYAIDSFNQLMLSAELNAQQIQLFRAYSAYSKQLKSTYSADYVAQALISNAPLCHLLAEQFDQRFNPTLEKKTPVCDDDFFHQLNQVVSLDHDTIIKTFYELIKATCRTNYYQQDHKQQQILSFKFISSEVPLMPKPTPAFEIFVYSKRFEGIHLRGGKVARGGLRWSNRLEDYRTEVLGLMKAQMVKNAVIVPTGSKGGFVCKLLNVQQTREQQRNEVEQCYRLYIHSLLNLSDNLVNKAPVHPSDSVIYDQQDPYLVVAADKGTAQFSDIANSIAQQHNFWLDDAFASGGSQGYDHKKMGITARGAWESVKRHFKMINIDCQQQAFSVIGIGDMSGDVFGNGMLLSTKIQLIAAFNHLHIFIDPAPNTAKSYLERQRLFQLPRSSWDDYDSSLISQGGGVFKRSSKKIPLSKEIKQLLGVNAATLTPNQLITALLKAKADLLWNGGIGTYVKAEHETDSDAQDKANDQIRINGSELNVKIIGEGGNLGMTQLGRIEFAEHGGDLYSDAIDNSAGVDCSDHEVNIKILLQHVIADGLLDQQQRNQLLHEMTDEVAKLTLNNNIKQTQIIDMMALQAHQNGYEHLRFINHLEQDKVLSRKLEFLPAEAVLKERIAHGKGLYKPELSVLLSYSKLIFKHALLDADIFDSPFFEAVLIRYFPQPLQQRYSSQIKQHPLKNDIIATVVANQLVNNLGIGYGFKMKEETGANIVQIVKAYICVIEIFNLQPLWDEIEHCNTLPEPIRYQCLTILSGLIQRSISWIIRSYPNQLEINFIIERFKPPAAKLKLKMYALLSGDTKTEVKAFSKRLKKHKASKAIIEQLPAVIPLSSTFDISEIALELNTPVDKTAKLFYAVAKQLDLQWVKQNISKLPKQNHWHQLAIASMRNEIHRQQRKITFYLLNNSKNKHHIQRALDNWTQQNSFALNRYQEKISLIKNSRTLDYALFVVLVNELRLLSQQLSCEVQY